jgi:O-antigen/teichoic acid export membrane protein
VFLLKLYIQGFCQNISDQANLKLSWLRRFLKSEIGLVYTTIGTMGSSLLGGIFWFILASLLDVESYGLTNYYIALASVFAAVALMGLDATVITYMAKGEKKILYQANSLILISGLVVTGLLSVFQWSSGILAIAMVFFMMVLAETLGRKRYRQYAFLSIGQRIAQIILSLILYFLFGIIGIVFGYFLGNLIFSYRYLKFIPNFTTQIDSVKEKRNFAFHSYGFNLIRNLTNYLDKLIIAPVFGYYVLGMYQLGFQFFMFLSIIPLSLYYYLLPEESSGKDKRKMKILGFSVAVMASLLAVIAFPYVIEDFFPTFIDSIPLVRIMSLAVIPSTIVAMLNATFLGKGKSKSVLFAGLIYIISLITGLIVLGQFMGGLGLAITLVVAQSIQAIYLLIKRNCTC